MLEPEDESGANMVLQNLIALNTSLFKENEKKDDQLREMKKKLEAIEDSATLRTKVEAYEKELLNKNRIIEQLISKLQLVRNLTDDLSNVKDIDYAETEPILVQRNGNCQLKYSPARSNSNGISCIGQRKISHFFPNGSNDTDIRPLVKEKTDSHTDHVIIETDDQETEEKSLLICSPVPKTNSSTQEAKKVCNKCGKKFPGSKRLRRYERIAHPVGEPKAKIRNADQLKAGTRSTDQPEAKTRKVDSPKTKTRTVGMGTFACDICGVKFAHKGNIPRHKKNAHP